MTETHRCPQCGTRLGADAPHGLCPRCLVQGALDDHDAAEISGKTSPWRGTVTPPTPKELAPLFDQLEVIELLGRGGMGAVYRARHIALDRMVALKVLPPDVARDPTFAERFTREARALAKLNHPNIVAVYDSGQVNGLYYFIMEFIDGVNLRQALAAGELSTIQAMAIVPQVCDALQYAHDEGVVHRDVKPENVLLDKKGRVKVADFGLAKLLGRAPVELTLTSANQVLGTLHYMAPEQIERPFQVDHRADIYSLGVVFYELLTGELPLGRFKLPSEKAVIDARLDDVVLKTLERSPEERYQHASEVKSEVEQISRAAPIGAPPQSVELKKQVLANDMQQQQQQQQQQFAYPSTREQEPSTAQRRRRRVSCPFTISSLHGGFAKALGIARVEEKGLSLEFEVRDELFGMFRKGPQTVLIPWDEMVSVQWNQGWLSNKITVQTDHLTATADVPGSDRGRISLETAGRDTENAMRIVQTMQRTIGTPPPDSSSPSADDSSSWLDATSHLEEARSMLAAPARGMWIGGTVNLLCGVFLGLGFLIASTADDDFIPGAIMFLSCLPVGAVMVTAGWQLSRLQHYLFCRVAVVGAVLPVSPLVTINLFISLWAWLRLNNPEIRGAFKHVADGLDRSTGFGESSEPIAGKPTPAPHSQAYSDRTFHDAYEAVNAPAWALMALGLFSIVFPLGFQGLLIAMAESRVFRTDDFIAAGVPFFLSIPAGIVMLIGGASMRRMGSRSMAKAAALAALIPLGPQFLTNLPIALWAMSILNRSEVKAAFEFGGIGPEPPIRPVAGRWTDIQIAVVVEQLKGVGIGLVLLGVLNVMLPLCVEGALIAAVESRFLRDDDMIAAAFPLFLSIPVGVLMVIGGWSMHRLSSYRLGKIGLLAAMAPCSVLWLLSFPFAIRGWSILRKPEAAAAFRKR